MTTINKPYTTKPSEGFVNHIINSRIDGAKLDIYPKYLITKQTKEDNYKPFLIVVPHFYKLAKEMLSKTFNVVKDQKAPRK